MDGSQFPPYFWDNSSETQRRPPPLVNRAPVAGGLPSFVFLADYAFSSTPSMDPTGFFAHEVPPLPSVLFPSHRELSAPSPWDAVSSWLPASTQQPSVLVTQWAQYNPTGMIPFTAFSQQRLDPLPLVQVQEISLMTATASISSWQTSAMNIRAHDFHLSLHRVSLKTTIGHPVGGHLAVHIQFRRRHQVSTAIQLEIARHPYLLKSDHPSLTTALRV
ncbi:hypothetical protein DFH09DRAFT_1369864, partial [Mycena vulgaris]